MWRDEATLLDVHEAARLTAEFGSGRTADDFGRDDLLRSAVLYQLAVLGEAVKRLSPAFRDAHPEIPWKRVAGLRDQVIHGYDRVQLAIIVDAVNREIPSVLERLKPLMPAPPPGHDVS